MGDKPHVRHIVLLALFALNVRSTTAWPTDGVCVSRFTPPKSSVTDWVEILSSANYREDDYEG